MDCIVCLKVGDLYSSEYVNNLYRAVRNYTQDDFICFTDTLIGIDPGVICYPIGTRESEGWWPTWCKIEIFGREELKKYTRKVYFDLDIVIQGDISPILEHDAELAFVRCTWKGFKFARSNPKEPCFNTDAMVWKDASWIYEKWESDWRNIVKTWRGTDKWYHNAKVIPTYLPKVFYSYREGFKPEHYWDSGYTPYLKYHPEFAVCVFHQKPNIHELDPDHILYKHWNGTI